MPTATPATWWRRFRAAAHHEPAVRAAARELGRSCARRSPRCPPTQRDAFLLQYEGGLSLAEIAESPAWGRKP